MFNPPRCFTLIFLMFSCASMAQTTLKKYLSGTGKDATVNWDFMCTAGRNSGKWTTIPVPSNWELQGFGNYTYGFEKEDKNEAGMYRHTFTLPASWDGKQVLIVFDGSMTDTEVKINGQPAGVLHQGAFYRFKYDITKLLKQHQPNLLEVRVNKVSSNQTVNEAERTADFWVFGGIFRPVFLEAYPRQHIKSVNVDARANGEVKIKAYPVNIQGPAIIIAQLKDRSGKIFGRSMTGKVKPGDTVINLTGKFNDPALWSSEFPNLYKLEVSLKKDNKTLHTVTETMGFRTIELRKHDGFYINGQKIRFKGTNRGAFWPTTGRTTNRQISIEDVKLIKNMNMNAVRMSHYPPDDHFLETCDSLGLYVIDELTGWQYPPYDTRVGKKLVREMIEKDINHPSVVMWANGNEGGFNFDLLPDYPVYDLQKRPVIQPWSNLNGINTKHYIPWNYGIGTFFQGNDVFFPTEFLHGLYDGGQGAGLDDFWNLMLSNPLAAGGFLWDFCDQAIVRTDKGGILDTKGNSAADGILGPYREKEGSFFTVKEIWSPVYINKKTITENFNGIFNVENRYHFTNLNRCSFSFKLKRINSLKPADTAVITGKISPPDIKPQTSGLLRLALPVAWKVYDVLYVTARDLYGRELYTWSWPVTTPQKMARRMMTKGTGTITVDEHDNDVVLKAGGVTISLDKRTGLLNDVKNNKESFLFNNGPKLIEGDAVFKSFRHYDTLGTHVAEVVFDGKQRYKFKWILYPSGWLGLTYQYRPENFTEMLGINFNYPAYKVTGMQLMGNGPYRVYKNRMKGVTMDTWKKTYNDAVTGEVWDYPEFKGYYSNFYGMRLQTREGGFTVMAASENLFLHMLNPAIPKALGRANSMAAYPAGGGISFMQGIPSIGTKSQKKEDLGPQSLPNQTFANGGLDTMQGELYFDFR